MRLQYGLGFVCVIVSSMAVPLGEQMGLDICPRFAVKCVIDGDWRHPVGELGKKRALTALFPMVASG